jgi:hypothetical protein
VDAARQTRDCRTSAIGALTRLSQTATPTDEQREKIAKAVAACLDGEMPRVRRAAVASLRELGRSASPALGALEALQAHDPDDSVRDLAKKAIERIQSTSTVPVELTRLREELDKLRRSQSSYRPDCSDMRRSRRGRTVPTTSPKRGEGGCVARRNSRSQALPGNEPPATARPRSGLVCFSAFDIMSEAA